MIHWQGGQIWKAIRPLPNKDEHYLIVDSRPHTHSNYGNDMHEIDIIVLETGEADHLLVRESTFLQIFTRVDDEPTLSGR